MEPISAEELASLIVDESKLAASPHLELRQDACEQLYELCQRYRERAESAIPALIDRLQDSDPKIQDHVAGGLRCCGQAAVRPLVDRLSDSNPVVRRNAAAALVTYQELDHQRSLKQIAGPLAKVLHDSNAEVRAAATAALGCTGDTSEATLEGLAGLIRSSTPSDRAAGLRAVGEIHDRSKSTAALGRFRADAIRLLGDKDANVRWAAVIALECCGLAPAELVSLLAAALGDPSFNVRGTSLVTLAGLAREHVDCSAAVPQLIRLISTDEREYNRGLARELLGEIGPAAKAAIPALQEQLNSSNESTMLEAVEALWKIDRRVDESLAAIERQLKRRSSHQEKLCDTLVPLGRHAAPLKKYIIEFLNKDGDWDVQWAAADTLGAIAPDDPDVIAALIACLGHKSGIVCSGCSRSLSKAGLKAVGPLIEQLQTGDAHRCEWAADALGRIGPAAHAAVGPLEKLLTSNERGVRAWSAIALGKINGSPAAVPVLIKALEQSDEQEQAALALAKIGPAAKAAEPALRRLLTTGGAASRAAAKQALEAISR